MLPNIYYQFYQEFAQLLEQLQTDTLELDAPGLRQSFWRTQQFFQQQILNLDSDTLEPAIESKIRSYQTEISKQLQLLSMDVTFLQAARQPATAEARKTQLLQRLQTLTRYCSAVLMS